MLLRSFFRYLLGFFFIVAGIGHFLNPDFFIPMVPPYVPSPERMVQVSGVAEILLGVLVLIPTTTRKASWGLIALLVAVFPANIHMATHPELFPDMTPLFLYLRLPLQGLFIFWAWNYARKP